MLLKLIIELDDNKEIKESDNKLSLKNEENELNEEDNESSFTARKDFTGEKTLKDYDLMSVDELIACDDRSFSVFYWNTIYSKHLFLRAFVYKTGIDPFYVRIPIFFTSLSINFALNAIFYSDEFISEKNDVVLDSNMV